MIDSDDSEFDSDEESELQDLEQINTAISQLQNEPCTSASLQRGTSVAATSSCSSTSTYEEYSKIETALAFNRMCDEKLRRLEGILKNRLVECRRRLSEVQTASGSDNFERLQRFNYVVCGKPYFRDKRGFSAPDNEDTILMKKSEMYDFSNVSSVTDWTVNDKWLLSKYLLKLSRNIKRKQLHSKILALQRRNKESKSAMNEKKILQLKKEIESVNKQTLKTLALPIEEEYDWDYVAQLWNHRHSAKECRALWKLYLHPSLNKNTWSETEHQSLQKIALEKNLQNWDAIAKELGTNRTNYQCFVYYRANMSNTFTSRKWTKEEEEYLLRLIEYYREDNFIPWGKVSASMDNRTKIQVYNKYARLAELRKGKFLIEEDSVILNCVNIYGRDFRKVAEYLQGRSVTQCRQRYYILNKRQYSTVWTVEDDQKVIELMANPGDTCYFSTLAKYFPGKDRAHIRTRYLTLCKWMRRNPNVDIKHAPRRSARRLIHGKFTDDLNTAVENLKKRLEAEVINKKKSKISKDSPENVIDDAIVAFLTTEKRREMVTQKLQPSQAAQETDLVTAGENVNCNITALQKLLVLMKAKLNKHKFKNNPLRNKFGGLLNIEPGPITVRIRSYSRKEVNKNINMDNKINIWGNALSKQLSYLLPPHYQTIQGCKQLLMLHKSLELDADDYREVNRLIRRNMRVKDEVFSLMERFNSIFLWPLILAHMTPEQVIDPDKYQHHYTPKQEQSRKYPHYGKEDYNFIMPLPNCSTKTEDSENENIDLVESKEDSHKIVIDENYFGTFT